MVVHDRLEKEHVPNLVCQEQYGSLEKRDFIADDSNIKMLRRSSKQTSFTKMLKDAFLPQGYPESVSSDYLSYQIWDTVQAFASSITGTLASKAVLEGVGVGNENATVIAATMTWLLKDGAGMIGRILFAWAKGSGLDYDAKRWRLFADILNDISIFIRIIGPYFESFFTLILCIASICGCIVGVAGGCTRAALTVHQARRNNMADVSAKDGSQETLVNLTGLIISLILVPIISDYAMLVWPLFIIFTSLHIYANYRAVRAVCMESLNQARFHIIVEHFLDSRNQDVLPVKTVNLLEPVVFPMRRPMDVKLGVSMNNIVKSGVTLPVLKAVYGNRVEGYILAVDFTKRCIYIVLSTSADTMDEIQACFHAELINYIVDKALKGQELKPELRGLGKLVKECLASSSGVGRIDDAVLTSVLSSSLHFTESSISTLVHELHDKNWTTERTLLGPDEWRATWNFEYGMDKTLFDINYGMYNKEERI